MGADDEDPEGHYFETVGDAAGRHFQSDLGRKDELLGLIVFAEAAEREGDTARADRLVAEIYETLAQGSGAPALTLASAGPEFEFDPRPPEVPAMALLERAEHDYEALAQAVTRWRDGEERGIDRWRGEGRRDHDGDPASRFADTVGEDGGIRFQQIQSKAEDLRAEIRRAAACEERGDLAEADRAVAAVRDAIGITDDAVPQIEAYLYDAARKAAARRRVLTVIWALVMLVGIAAAVFMALR